MSSIRRLVSSRMNAAHSTGPRTPAGKQRSSRNALRHGCRSRKPLPDAENAVENAVENQSPANFTRILHDYLASFGPTTPEEHALIAEMAAARSRQSRVQLRQTQMWNQAAETHHTPAAVWTALCETPGFVSLDRYEIACHRIYYRALDRFRALRRAHKHKYAPTKPLYPSLMLPPRPKAPPFLMPAPFPPATPVKPPSANCRFPIPTASRPKIAPMSPRPAVAQALASSCRECPARPGKHPTRVRQNKHLHLIPES